MKNKRYCYRNGVVLIDTHPSLLQGQVVQVIGEFENSYSVRVNANAQVVCVVTKDILIN